ncbi:general secretion pathway protein GspD [Ideonella azotifigens]|nr:general secretion pathway protein GspD [Ideonella azotifigens]MCD2345007.1 general secretion pathway protein GspD [Ideonella azotifigens]
MLSSLVRSIPLAGAKRGARVLCLSALFGATLLGLSGCAGLVQHEASEQAASGQPEQALRTLEDGLRRYPEDANLRAQYLTLRDATLQGWLDDAARQRSAGRPDEAERLIARALALDATNGRAQAMLAQLRLNRRLASVLDEAQGLHTRGQLTAALRVIDEGLKSDPQHAGLQALKLQIQAAQRSQQLQSSQAGLAEQRPISLDFRDAGLRQVLDLVSRNSGLNFVLDKDIRQDLKVTVYLKQVRVEDALDLIVSTHQLARKVLDDRTVLIYPNTPDKQREYQEQVIRVFYLASAEAKGAASFLKSMLKLKDPFVDERSNMLALREAPETVALAERLIGLYDTQEPEVLLELEVLEIRSTRLTELGLQVPSSISLSALAPSSGGGLTIANLRNLDDGRIGVSVGSVTLNLRREVGDFEILANPRVRARNREKAKVLIGDKVPIITTTTSQTGFVSDSVSYLDVGLKLEIEPTIYANDEVLIKLALEVGSLASQIKTTSGTVAYQISTRNASTALRLKDGETQLLAGLLSKEDRTSASRIPLVGDVPVLGRLFSSQLDDGSRTELVLAITPRIVRNLRQPDPSEAELWVGTEAYTRLRQVGGRVAPELPAKPDGNKATAPATAPAPNAAPNAAPAAGPAVGNENLPLLPMTFQWQGPATVKAGQVFTLALDGETPLGLRSLNLGLQGVPGALHVTESAAGDFWGRDPQTPVSLSASDDEDTGAIDTGALRSKPTVAPGKGRLFEWRMVAPKPGRYSLSMGAASVVTGDGQRGKATPPPAFTVEVQP